MAVVATGFFDGVHLGHRLVIDTLLRAARERGEQSVIVTFWPHPRTVLQKDARELRLLSSLQEKRDILAALGVDRVEVVDFSREFRSLTAEEYLRDWVRDRLGGTAVVLGYDNRMGSDGLPHDAIVPLAQSLGLDVLCCPAVSGAPSGDSSGVSSGEWGPENRLTPFAPPHCSQWVPPSYDAEGGTDFQPPTPRTNQAPQSQSVDCVSLPGVARFSEEDPSAPEHPGQRTTEGGTVFHFHTSQTQSGDCVSLPGVAISSTKIRVALEKGDVAEAEAMLGYRYGLHGVVVAGNRLGRTLGYPTANMQLYEPLKLVPANGVYLTEVETLGGHFYGMTNIGVRPTVSGAGVRTIETHIFDFDELIYGLDLRLRFVSKIRDERRFDSLDSLKAQLASDEALCRSLLSS